MVVIVKRSHCDYEAVTSKGELSRSGNFLSMHFTSTIIASICISRSGLGQVELNN